MGNLRPAPAQLTPQRIDSLIKAIDQYDGVAKLHALGLAPDDIARVRKVARRRGTTSVETLIMLLRAALDAVEGAA